MLIQARIGVGSITGRGGGGGQKRSTYVFLMSNSINLYDKNPYFYAFSSFNIT